MKEIFKEHIIPKISKNGLSLSNGRHAVILTTQFIASHNDLDQDSWKSFIYGEENYDFKEGTKIFFLPGCKIPRFKVRDLCKQIKCSIVREYNKADVIISGRESTSLIQYEYLNKVQNRPDVIDAINNYYQEWRLEEDPILSEAATKEIENTKMLLEKVSEIEILLDHQARWYIEKDNKSLQTKGGSYWTADEKSLEMIDYIMNNNIPIVNQNVLSSMLNTVTMNEEIYTEMDKMISSEDSNNCVLAMEMMANCDYEKSAIYLLFLLKNHFYKLKENKVWSHVNFTALKEFFGLKNRSISDLEDIIEILKEKGLLTSESVPDILSLKQKEVQYERYRDGDWFEADIYLKPSQRLINTLSGKITDEDDNNEPAF